MMLYSSVDELLAALIRIPSVNPEGDPGVEDAGELACAQFLHEYLSELGARAELQTVMENRPNVLARFPTAGEGKPAVLFAPHTDTVSVLGMTVDPFGGKIRDGKIFGRGASDTKGPMAAMLFAIQELRGELDSLPVEVWFAGLMGEEAGQHGAKALTRIAKPNFVIVGEPTGMDIVHAHKGQIWIKLETPGKAAHASTPESGRNAIEGMLAPLHLLKEEISAELATVKNSALGSPTLNIGLISGGTKVNIVPNACSTMIDIRTVPELDSGPFIQNLKARLEACSPGITMTWGESKPLMTDPDNPFIDSMLEAGSSLTTAPWFCDAAVFGRAGIPSVAIGPGSIRQAHTSDEFIALDDLRSGVEYFKKLLTGFSNLPGRSNHT